MNCPLTNRPKQEEVCQRCMYYALNKDPPCLFNLDLSDIEFAQAKGVSIEEMHQSANRLKLGIMLAYYSDYCRNLNKPDTFVGRAAIDTYARHPTLSLVGCTPALLQTMCDKSVWEAFKKSFDLQTAKLGSLLGIKKSEYSVILLEKDFLMKLRGYTIAELEKNPDSGPVFVVNRTAGVKRGDVFLVIARPNGNGSDSVNIPSTWIPVDLTSVIKRSQLLNDNNFRQAVTMGMLQLVHPEDAAALFEQSKEARQEFQRIANYLIKGGMAGQDQAASHAQDVELALPENEDDEVQAKEVQDAGNPLEEEAVVPTYIQAFLNDVKFAHEQDELDEEKVITLSNRLRSFGQLPEELLKHIYRETKPYSKAIAKTARSMADE